MNDSKPEILAKTPGAISRGLTQIAPFLLPYLFFQSALFTLLSPLPLFIVTLKKPLWFTTLALMVNFTLLYFTGAPTEAGIALFFWFSVGILFPFLIKRSGRIPLSLLLSFIYFVGIVSLIFTYLAHQSEMGTIDYVRSQISLGLDHLVAIPDSPVKPIVDEAGRPQFMKQLMTELPSGFLIATLIAFWLNLLFASQIVSGFLSPEFWAKYKNPEWLVWPTLACGALFAFTEHAPYFIGLNLFKVLLVFYGFQGLSVISGLLNRFKIVGFGRALVFCFATFVAMPLVLSLGFFDLWFDFRAKFGQS